MPPARREGDLLGLGGALLDRDRPGRAYRRDVEGEGVGRPDVRFAEAAEQHPQHRVGVGRRPDRRTGIRTHPLLVDNDRGRQPFEDVDLWPALRRHEPLQERAVGLVDQPLRFRRDGAEHQRRLARSRDAGEHRDSPLGDLDADVLQVVLSGALDADQVVTVCGCCWRKPCSRSCRPDPLTAGGGVQVHRGCDDRLQGLLVDRVVLVEVNRASEVAFEAGVEEA